MPIYEELMNSYMNENYNEERVKELLGGIKIPQSEVDKKIEFACNNFGLKPSDIKKCVFYGRVSTTSKQQASSIVNQHGIAEQFERDFISKGHIIIEEVFERESATKASSRKKFMDIVDRATLPDCGFNFIVVKAVDRMFRNVDDTMEIMRKLKKHKIGLLFYYENLNSLDPDDRNEIIKKANEAEEYSVKLSKSVRMGMRRNYRAGKGRFSSYAFGYDKPIVNDSAIAIINPTEAKLVEELFKRYAYTNDSLGEITVDWRARGIKSKLGKEITTVGLRRILTNKLYTGVLLNDRQVRDSILDDWKKLPEDQWKVFIRPDLRIISDELFDAAQRRIEKESFGHKHMLAVPKERIFKSMIQCPICGKNFKQIKNGRNSDGEYNLYYVCATHKQKTSNAVHLDCANRSRFRKDEMLYVLSLYFKEMLENRDDIEELVRNSVNSILKNNSNEVEVKDYSREISIITEKYKMELDLVREGLVDDKIRLKELKKELDNLKSMQAMEKKKAELNYDVDEVMNKLFSSIGELVETGMKEETLDAIKFNSIFDSIIATDDNRLIFNLRGSRIMSETFKNSGLDNNNKIGTFITPTELEKIKVPNSIYSERQLEFLENQSKKLYFISCEKMFNINKLYDNMNDIRNSSPELRRRYRYSLRYRGLGRDIIDSVNIVL